jgi:group I intron endonuclease
MYGIIYKATGPTGKVYIGQTVKTLNRRKSDHGFRAKKGDCRGAFQIALLEHGLDAFTWEQICTADTLEELNEREIYWIAHYDSTNPEKGYNLAPGGLAWSPSGETRRKLSEANKGQIPWIKNRHHSEETRRKLSEAHKGKHPSEKTRKKLSEAGKGRSPSPETRRKIGDAERGKKNHWFGKNFSEEYRRKLSEAHKGEKLSTEHCQKIGVANKGEKNPAAKLDEDKVKEILRRYKNGGVFQTTLSVNFNVSVTTISRIVRRHAWTHIVIEAT